MATDSGSNFGIGNLLSRLFWQPIRSAHSRSSVWGRADQGIRRRIIDYWTVPYCSATSYNLPVLAAWSYWSEGRFSCRCLKRLVMSIGSHQWGFSLLHLFSFTLCYSITIIFFLFLLFLNHPLSPCSSELTWAGVRMSIAPSTA